MPPQNFVEAGGKKRILSVFLTLALCLTLLPTAALATAGGISYVDGDGNNAICTEYTTLTDINGEGTLDTGWYVVSGTVTIQSDRFCLNGDVNLILCDGATLTVSGGFDGINQNENLSIYGQSAGTGELYMTGAVQVGSNNYNAAISIGGDLKVYGGKVTVESHYGEYSIYVGGNMQVFGGEVTAKASTEEPVTLTTDSIGIYVGGTMSVSSGKVTGIGGAVNHTENEHNCSSTGIQVAGGSMLVNGGEVIATGGNITVGEGFGHNAASYGLYAKAVTVKNKNSVLNAVSGTVTTATGSTAETVEYDIYCNNGDMVMDADGTVQNTAAGGAVKVLVNGNLTADGTIRMAAGSKIYASISTSDTANYNAINGNITLWHRSNGGGSSAPVTPPTVTIPVASDHAGEVTIDVSGLKNVESATVPSHVVEKTNKAENTGLSVALPAGSVTLDETALGSVTENANGKDVTVSVVSVPTSNLPPVVKDIIGMEPTVLAVVDVNVTISGKKQSSFDGGKVTISVPYTPKAGEDTSKLTVWFIKDNGTIENKGGYYDAEKKCFVFETEHLSQYLLVNTNELVSFTDVSADAYYAKAVARAVENGITDGIDNNQFAPDLTCTRAQAVAFLFRYKAANGMDAVTPQELVGGYGDAAQVPDYALPAFNWALAKSIVQGYNGNLMPNNDCTRAQIVTMLYRLLGTN